MAKIPPQKQRGWLNKSEMAASLGVSVQAFDKWGVQPVDRIGREVFYSARSVLDHRLAQQSQKQQPDLDGEGLDPLAEHKLIQERLRLTSAQAYSQEKKNEINDRQLVPVGFAAYVLGHIAPQISSILDTVSLKVKRKHPDMDPRFIETFQREIAAASNLAADLGDLVPGLLDDYVESLAD